MATAQATTMAAARIAMLQSVMILTLVLVPWPQSWTGFRSVIASARSPELNRADARLTRPVITRDSSAGATGPRVRGVSWLSA